MTEHSLPHFTKEEFENFKTYELAKNKTHRRVEILSLVVSGILLFFYYHIRNYFLGSDFNYLTGWEQFSHLKAFAFQFCFFYFEFVLAVLITSLCGKTCGAIFVWFVFNVTTLSNSNGFSYGLLVMLAAALIANLPARRRWFYSFPKTLLAILVMTLVMGTALGTVFSIYLVGIPDKKELVPILIFLALYVSFMIATISSLLLYLYHRFMPQKIKKLFPESDFSSPEIRRFQKQIVKNRKNHIGGKIICVIIVGSVLVMMVAAGVAGALLNELNNVPSEAESCAFMTKLVQVIVLETIPWIFLVTDFIRVWVAGPLILMSMAVQESSEHQKNPSYEIIADINKLEIENKDEIGVLYDSLKRADGHLHAYLKSVEEKIELEKNLVSAKAASEAKSTFLSSMSHEIRTPINAVLGLDEMILRECDDKTIRSYAQDIQSSGKSLLSIINDILDFSKIEAGKMEIIPADYDLSVMISDLVNMTAGRAESKGLNFIVNVDENMPHKLHGDEARIKQCILNVLTNAVKYTPAGSVTMNIGFEKRDDENIFLKTQVVDTGIGIKEEDLKKLFSPFERIEESRNRSIEGTGLGMSIVKNLLAAMGTHLDVKSVYGKGSDFSFSVAQGVTDWEKIGNYEETKQKFADAQNSYQESFQAPEAKILVVDDTPMNLTVMKGLLKATRIQIDTAENGIVGLEKARSQKYDVIFIDHLMPKMDGLEMLAELKKTAGLNDGTPCIALTANAISGAKEMYLDAGFTSYLSKPIDSAQLEAMLQEYLPSERVLHKGDAGFEEKESVVEPAVVSTSSTTVAPNQSDSLFASIFALDSAQALKNCGSAEVFLQAAENFYESIEEKSAQIEQFAATSDWKNYTILVHALKSSARLIGAMELSEKAKELEALGNEAQKEAAEAITEIREKTPGLVENYRAYLSKLAPLVGKTVISSTSDGFVQASSSASVGKPALTEEKLLDAFSALTEVVSAFDFDTADSIIAELDGYEIPSQYEAQFKQAKKAIRDVDAQKALKVLAVK